METWTRTGFYWQFNTLPLPGAPPGVEEFRGSQLISAWSLPLSDREKDELCSPSVAACEKQILFTLLFDFSVSGGDRVGSSSDHAP